MSKLFTQNKIGLLSPSTAFGGGGGGGRRSSRNHQPVRLSEEAEQRVRDGELGEEADRAQTERDAQRAKSAISLITGNAAEADRKNNRINLNPRSIIAEEAGHRLVDEKVNQADRIRDANQLLNQ